MPDKLKTFHDIATEEACAAINQLNNIPNGLGGDMEKIVIIRTAISNALMLLPGIQVNCLKCRQVIVQKAALLFGPPENNVTPKEHLCAKCYDEVLNFIRG